MFDNIPWWLFTDTVIIVQSDGTRICPLHMTFSHIQNKLFCYPSRDVTLALENPDNICGGAVDGEAQQA